MLDAVDQLSDFFDETEARQLARFALGKSVPAGKSPAADMQTRHAKGEMRLKPAKSDATISHATATRRSQYSRELMGEDDWERSRIARVIYGLDHPHPIAISWRHHGDKSVREMAQDGMVNLSMTQFMSLSPHNQLQALQSAKEIVRPGGVRSPWELPQHWMTYGEWRNSTERKLWEQVQRVILAMETAALRAMMAEMDGVCDC